MKTVAIRRYISSPSTIFGGVIGFIMYCSYAYAHIAWDNSSLIIVSAFIAIMLPSYSRASNKLEEKINLQTALVSAGRLGRFSTQFAFNLAVFYFLIQGGVFKSEDINGLGGIIGVAALTTCASQGIQYLSIMFFNRGYGDVNRNVLLALSVNIIVTAAATTGIPYIKPAFVLFGVSLGIFFFSIGFLSDLRSFFYPQSGVGVFFGTFNPFHLTHVAIVKNALDSRNLEKVYIHPTIVPKLHIRAFDRNEIKIEKVSGGKTYLGCTELADMNVNYFPTGRRFFAPKTRKIMIEAAIAEAGLSERVEVIWEPKIYEQTGFYGILKKIRALHPSLPLHGIHGSDLGGMWVRNIYDEFGWLYPFPIKRRDGVSATAIRDGAYGMTCSSVALILENLRAEVEIFSIGDRRYSNVDGHLKEVN